MARFPKIQRPCPVQNSLDDYMDGDKCRLCKRNVVDIGVMNDAERDAFFGSCKTEVCVSYTLPLRHAAAAMALSASASTVPAAAQDALTELGVEASVHEELPKCAEEFEEVWVIVGGIKDVESIEYVDTPDDLEIPELPVTYELVSETPSGISEVATNIDPELAAPTASLKD